MLTCTEKQINLRIYDETFCSEIIVSKRKDIVEVLSNTKYYNIPIGYIDENSKSEVVFTVEKNIWYEIEKLFQLYSILFISKMLTMIYQFYLMQ